MYNDIYFTTLYYSFNLNSNGEPNNQTKFAIQTTDDKKEFENMFNNYYRHSQIIINAGYVSFPSKSLVIVLLTSEVKK
jgi:hypothetical protein